MPGLPEQLLPAGRDRSAALLAIDAVALLLLGGGLAALYGPHLNAPLVFDDIDFFAGNYAARYGGQFSPLLLRYWSYASFAFQQIVCGSDPAGLRLVNVVLHLMVGAALCVFQRTLLGMVLPGRAPRAGFGRDLAIWLGVALFLFHPVAVYGVAYLVGRSMVLATLFSLLMWWAHLRGLASGRPEWFALALLCCYLALYSKEHSVMAPAVAGLLTLLAGRRAARRSLLGLVFLAYGVLAASVLFAHSANIGSAYEPMSTALPHAYLASVLTQAALFFKYLWLWWVPLPAAMAIDIREPLAGIDSVAAWLWLGGFLAYVAAAFGLLLRKGCPGILGFALLAPALLFMTEFSAVRMQESFVLYRSYLWMPALLLILPLLFEAAGKRGLALGVAVCAVLWVLSGQRLDTFASPLRLWDEAIQLAERRGDTSGRDRQYVNRGGAYLAAGQADLALQDFEQALRWNPAQAMALLGQGRARARLGRTDLALLSFGRALAVKPGWVEAYLARAELHYKLNQLQAAASDFGQACAQSVLTACYAQEKLRLGASATVTIIPPRP